MTFNERLAAARRRVARLEDELAGAYETPLRIAARRAVTRFKTRTVTAAVQPLFPEPDPDELVDTDQVAAKANEQAQPLRERALRAVTDAAVGISFDVKNPFAAELIGGVSERSAVIIGGFADQLAGVLRDAQQQGLSVVDAADLLTARGVDISRVTARLLARTDLNSIANGGSLLAAQLVDQASLQAGEAGVGGKTWVTAGDERVRDIHTEADGQTVPLAQPFDVGGEQLMYPGDPNGSDENTLNCRCTVVYGGDSVAAAGGAPVDALQSSGTVAESPADTVTVEPDPASLVAAAVAYSGTPVKFGLHDFHLTAAVGEPTRWQATLLVEDEPTEDGRMIAADGATWRPLPLPLAIRTDSGHADDADAPVCGRIDQIWRAGNLIQAAGVFDTSDIGVEAERLVRERMITGISCDGACTASEVVVTRRDDSAEDRALEDEVDGVTGGDPVIEEAVDDDLEYLFVATEYVIMGATICPAGAIARARIDVVAAAADEPDRWRLTSVFETTSCDVPPAAAAVVAAVDPARLDDLEARLDTLAESVTSVAQRITGKLDGVEALLIASAAALDQVDGRFAVLSRIESEIGALRSAQDRKPRQVEFKRDADGRLEGLVETP